MKVLLLSNINMQPLVRALKPWVVTCGAYNSLLSDLSIAGSAADAADVSHVFCLYDSDALMGDAFYGAGPPAQCDTIRAGAGWLLQRPSRQKSHRQPFFIQLEPLAKLCRCHPQGFTEGPRGGS